MLADPTQAAGALDVTDDEGITALMYACMHGLRGVVEQLVAAGAKTDVTNANKMTVLYTATPLYIAAEKGHGKVVAAQLKAGCDTCSVRLVIDDRVRGVFVEHHEKQQRKVLAMAGGLHDRLGAGSFVFRLDHNLLKMIWDCLETRCAVPPGRKAARDAIQEVLKRLFARVNKYRTTVD